MHQLLGIEPLVGLPPGAVDLRIRAKNFDRTSAVDVAFEPGTIAQVLGAPVLEGRVGERAGVSSSGVEAVALLPKMDPHPLLKLLAIGAAVIGPLTKPMSFDMDDFGDRRMKDIEVVITHGWASMPETGHWVSSSVSAPIAPSRDAVVRVIVNDDDTRTELLRGQLRSLMMELGNDDGHAPCGSRDHRGGPRERDKTDSLCGLLWVMRLPTPGR